MPALTAVFIQGHSQRAGWAGDHPPRLQWSIELIFLPKKELDLLGRRGLGSLRRSPRPLVGWGGGHPIPNSHSLGAFGASIALILWPPV